MVLTDKLTEIADAIRLKTGGTASMTLDQMATEIANIQTGGGIPDSLLCMVKGANTTGESSGGVIDTGVSLGSLTDWTFTAEFTTTSTLTGNYCMFHAMNEATGYAGFTIDRITNGVKGRMAIGSETIQLYNTSMVGRTNRIVVKCSSNVVKVFTDYRSSGYTFSTAFNTASYPNVTLVVGGYKQTSGSYGRYVQMGDVNMTVYNEALSDADCIAYING